MCKSTVIASNLHKRPSVVGVRLIIYVNPLAYSSSNWLISNLKLILKWSNRFDMIRTFTQKYLEGGGRRTTIIIYLSTNKKASKQTKKTDDSGTKWKMKRAVCIDGPEKTKYCLYIGDGNPYSHINSDPSDTDTHTVNLTDTKCIWNWTEEVSEWNEKNTTRNKKQRYNLVT